MKLLISRHFQEKNTHEFECITKIEKKKFLDMWDVHKVQDNYTCMQAVDVDKEFNEMVSFIIFFLWLLLFAVKPCLYGMQWILFSCFMTMIY